MFNWVNGSFYWGAFFWMQYPDACRWENTLSSSITNSGRRPAGFERSDPSDNSRHAQMLFCPCFWRQCCVETQNLASLHAGDVSCAVMLCGVRTGSGNRRGWGTRGIGRRQGVGQPEGIAPTQNKINFSKIPLFNGINYRCLPVLYFKSYFYF